MNRRRLHAPWRKRWEIIGYIHHDPDGNLVNMTTESTPHWRFRRYQPAMRAAARLNGQLKEQPRAWDFVVRRII